MEKLVQRITQKVMVDYLRLSIVSNPDGLLTDSAVQSLLMTKHGIEVVCGSQLDLRIHFELVYKTSDDSKRFIYVCPDTSALLQDMRQSANVCQFSSSDLFPLFADKSLLRKQSAKVLAEILRSMGNRRIAMPECRFMVESINARIMAEREKSAAFFKDQFKSATLDWSDVCKTATSVSNIIAKAADAGVYDDVAPEFERINDSFQSWLDESYFALQNSSPMLNAQCVNKILPHIAGKHNNTEKVALLVVDGLALWQWCILRDYLQSNGIKSIDKVTMAWIPTITMLSRQAIFRGANPSQDYKQNPENEKRLWLDFWKQKGFGHYEIQYISDADEFAVNEGVSRLAFVTVEMDEKMHACKDLKDLCSLTINWCPRITEQIKALKRMGFTIYLTADHGSANSTGWRALSQVEKVFLYKDGSRGKRHLIYSNQEELKKMYSAASANIPLLQHENWIAIRNNSAFHREGASVITHGGSNLTEVVVPFIQI